VAQGPQLTGRLESYEATQASPRDILEEDALDRILRAEVQDLVVRRVDDTRAHEWNCKSCLVACRHVLEYGIQMLDRELRAAGSGRDQAGRRTHVPCRLEACAAREGGEPAPCRGRQPGRRNSRSSI
jgi:hypothetical protein